MSNKNFALIVTYHPVTTDTNESSKGIKSLLESLDQLKDTHIIITYPNADEGGCQIIDLIKKYANENKSRVCLATSLGRIKYLSIINNVDLVLGNSSSGLIEVPSFNKPTVNIGTRQKGRLRGRTVIDVTENTNDIVSGIKKGLSDEFKSQIQNEPNIYGNGTAAIKIVNKLLKIDLHKNQIKQFFDL